MRTRVPDLRYCSLIVYSAYAGGEADANRRPAIAFELIAYEAGEHCGDEMRTAVDTTAPYCIRTVSMQSGRQSWVIRESLAMRVGAQRGPDSPARRNLT